jgi:GDP-4-dehydro-6-deoxy-D-mannose reductase
MMKRILITGLTGFVGEYLLDALNKTGERYEIIGLSRSYNFNSKLRTNLNVRLVKLDLNDKKHLQEVLYLTRPNYIYHLASDSSVSYSWQNPIESFQNNTNIFLNLIESVKALQLECRVLSIGSSEEYGLVDLKDIPLMESAPLNPISPYAVARVSQELLSKVYSKGYGIDIVMTRSFNHIGPGQKDNFVVSSFAKQIIKYKLGIISAIEVGNIDIVRDFLDVRDVVNAYIHLMEKGVSGEVYNICSNAGYSLADIIYKMMDIEKVRYTFEVNSLLIRPSDNPIIVGNNSKIKSVCGWQPIITIEQSLNDILSYWTNELA